MTWLLFMDESGHDHTNTPLEVRGGVAMEVSEVWNFVRSWRKLRDYAFGEEYLELISKKEGKEFKGCKLLNSKTFENADRMDLLDDATRHKNVKRFLTRSRDETKPKLIEFAAYAQSNLLMAKGIFNILKKHNAVVFASAIPKGAMPPKDFKLHEFLRKDHVFMQQRFFAFLEGKAEHGLFVMDQTENQQDKKFVRQLEKYYTSTKNDTKWSKWIVPSPLFVDSEMSVGVQAADVVIYCINWGFRIQQWQFKGNKRDDIISRFGATLQAMQFKGEEHTEGETRTLYGIVFVPDPYEGRQ